MSKISSFNEYGTAIYGRKKYILCEEVNISMSGDGQARCVSASEKPEKNGLYPCVWLIFDPDCDHFEDPLHAIDMNEDADCYFNLQTGEILEDWEVEEPDDPDEEED